LEPAGLRAYRELEMLGSGTPIGSGIRFLWFKLFFKINRWNFFISIKSWVMIIFFPFQVGLNFLINFAFQKNFEFFWQFLDFFYYKLIFFYVFVLLKKNMLTLCLVATLNPRNFNFFSLLQNNFFYVFILFLNIFKKIYWDFVWLKRETQEIYKFLIFYLLQINILLILLYYFF